jgi:hypothetical protein
VAAHHIQVDPDTIAAAVEGNNPPDLGVDLLEMRISVAASKEWAVRGTLRRVILLLSALIIVLVRHELTKEKDGKRI